MMPTNLLARNSTHTNFWLDSFNMLLPSSSGSSIMRSRIVIKICLIIIIICHNSECKNKMLETLRTCHNNIGKFRKHIKPLLKTNHSRNFLASGQFKQPFLTYFCLFLTNSLAKFAIFWFVLGNTLIWPAVIWPWHILRYCILGYCNLGIMYGTFGHTFKSSFSIRLWSNYHSWNHIF